MIIDVIVNRGTIEIIADSTVKSGTSALLSAGAHKITFPGDPFSDADYDLTLNVFNAAGVPSGFTRGALEADGFNITLSYESYVSYNANKMS